MVELVSSRTKIYVQETRVKKIEQRFKTEWLSGQGKDALTKEVPDGWWITFNDSLTALRCENKPDCEVGDVAVCTWEFKKA